MSMWERKYYITKRPANNLTDLFAYLLQHLYYIPATHPADAPSTVDSASGEVEIVKSA